MKFRLIILFFMLISPALLSQEIGEYEKNPDQPVIFEGGQPGFYKLIGKSIQYPKQARMQGMAGEIFVSFTVDATGQIRDIAFNQAEERGQALEQVVVVGYSSSGSPKQTRNNPNFRPFLEECERVINLLSISESGTKDGQAVATRMTLPIVFKLN